jgi:hypothetical protein
MWFLHPVGATERTNGNPVTALEVSVRSGLRESKTASGEIAGTDKMRHHFDD